MFMKILGHRIHPKKLDYQKKEDESTQPPCINNTLTNASTTVSKSYTYEYNDGENYEIVFDKFGNDPHEVLQIRHFDFIPRPEEKDDVVIIVEVNLSI